MEVIEKQSLKIAEEFHHLKDDEKRSELVAKYINDAEKNEVVVQPDWSLDSTWMNSKPLDQSSLNGKVVLLDFFTYCCINCIHMFPFVHQMESLHSVNDGLVVIGIHSAKFHNEKDTNNIKNALSRYNITHPVLNDAELKLWYELSIKCWPTFVVLSPSGKVLLSLPGEAHADVVEAVLCQALKYYSDRINHNEVLENEPSSPVLLRSPRQLKYPGKVSIDMSGDQIAIADTGNHRVLICSRDGRVKHVVGGCVAGRKDGNFTTCRFNSPQGVAWHLSASVFVADCDNHLIRKIDLNVLRVVTVVGTGQHGGDTEGGKLGTDQVICSPWDVVVGGSPRFPQAQSILYIAMSGLHQIWAFFLQDADWQKGSEYKMGTCIRFAGNGQEENRNNSYPHKAGFAQPSGLSVDAESHKLYVADSESSTVRRINLASGGVEGLVGGHLDPTNLFAFGDEDGKARSAKLQHPLGVSWDKKRCRLYVADSYNHKIKCVNPAAKTCSTLCGPEVRLTADDTVGYPAHFPAVKLDEPGGLCVDPQGECLYVADTNNHSVKTINLSTGEISEVAINFLAHENVTEPDSVLAAGRVEVPARLVSRDRAQKVSVKSVQIGVNETMKLNLQVADIHLTDDAPSAWQLTASFKKEDSSAESCSMLINSGTFETPVASLSLSVPISDLIAPMLLSRVDLIGDSKTLSNIEIALAWEASLYYCIADSSLCTMKEFVAFIPLCVNSQSLVNASSDAFAVNVVFPKE